MIPLSLVHAARILLVNLAQPAARALAFACLVAAALAAFRVRSVRLRLVAWTTVLYAALAIAVFGWVVPAVNFPVPASLARFIPAQSLLQAPAQYSSSGASQLTPNPATSKLPGLASVPRATKMDLALIAPANAVAARQNRAVRNANLIGRPGAPVDASSNSRRATHPAGSVASTVPGSEIPDAAYSQPRINFLWIVGAAAAYLTIALILLARLLLGFVLSLRLDRTSVKITDREALRKLAFRSYASGLECVPRLVESEMLIVPATLRVHDPVIVFPANWRSWEVEEFDAILAHEVAHVARRDALTQALSLLHRAIFWFSPLAWWLDRRLSHLAEEASDEAALGAGADRTRYAETLLGFFAEIEAAPGRIWWQGVSMAKAGTAARRVDHILSWKGAASSPLRKSALAFFIIAALPVTYLAAAVHPAIPQSQSAPPAKPASPQVPPALAAVPVTPAPPALSSVSVPPAPATPPQNVITSAPPSAVASLAKAPRASGVVAPPEMGTPPSSPPSPALAPEAPPLMGEAPAGALREVPEMPLSTPAFAAPHPGSTMAFPAAPGVLAPTPLQAAKPLPLLRAPGTNAVTLPQESQTMADAGDLDSLHNAFARFRAAEERLKEAQTQIGPTAAQLIKAKKALADARSQFGPESPQLAEAEKALSQAEALYLPSRDQLQAAKKTFMAAEQEVDAAKRALAQTQQGQSSAGNTLIAAEQEVDAAKRALAQTQQVPSSAGNTILNGDFTTSSGPRYVIMTANSNNVTMSGSDEDLDHARELRKKISGDFIWFERDEKSYVITDPTFIANAKALFAPEDALAKQQDELGRQQDELGKQQDALGDQMDSVKVKIPDISADLVRIQARLKDLQSSGATQEQLGRIQAQIGELQSELGRFQSKAGGEQSVIGRQQAELGRKQGELGRMQGELGRKQAAVSRQISGQLRKMFDEAISRGIAKPE